MSNTQEPDVRLTLEAAKKILEMLENFGAPIVYWEEVEKLAHKELYKAIRSASKEKNK